MKKGTIAHVNGPVVKVVGCDTFEILERVEVGENRLVGEVIGITSKQTTIQVYEPTTSLRIGDTVIGCEEPVSVWLAPGMLAQIFDGIQRPLNKLQAAHGSFLPIGGQVDALDVDKRWNVRFLIQEGQRVQQGQVYATTLESKAITHRLLVPLHLDGVVVSCKTDGDYTIVEPLMTIETDQGERVEVRMLQKWPIKKPRPLKERTKLIQPLVTGQRVIDTLFPIAKGGTAAVPGGFGTGKTMTQHQIAKWCDAQIIIYVGCGERGNEMSQVLQEFSELIDPKTQRPMLERTVLIANTSNMPVAAREASIYTGVTIAEYYRDMGYHVALMADSTSRWAEALRELSGRLEEMPAEEGFPAYLPSRLAQFYERAGFGMTYANAEGSVTIIGAVSPQGADFSEPVTQNTKRFVRCFWALDKALAYARHYAAINWTQSYSEYSTDLQSWYEQSVNPAFPLRRQQLMQLLVDEAKLDEIVKLIGSDVLPEDQKLILKMAEVIRVGYLQQNAFHALDTYVTLEKQMRMMELICDTYERAQRYVAQGIPVRLLEQVGIFRLLISMKYEVANDQCEQFDRFQAQIIEQLGGIKMRQGEDTWK